MPTFRLKTKTNWQIIKSLPRIFLSIYKMNRSKEKSVTYAISHAWRICKFLWRDTPRQNDITYQKIKK